MRQLRGVIIPPLPNVSDQVQKTFTVLSQRRRSLKQAVRLLNHYPAKRAQGFAGIIIFNRLAVDNRFENRYKGNKYLRGWNTIGKYDYRFFLHMKTFYEKITFILTALAYILFHLALSPVQDAGYKVDLQGTLTALMNTLPFEIGLTYIMVVFIRRISGGKWPPWDRILRIFFTIGILFGLIYNLYVRGAVEHERLDEKPTVSRSVDHGTRMGRSHSA